MNAAGTFRKKVSKNMLMVSVGFSEPALCSVSADRFFHDSLGSYKTYLYFIYSVLKQMVAKLER